MIISCPSCHKRYLVDDSLFLEAEREVRCGVCATVWTEKTPATDFENQNLDKLMNVPDPSQKSPSRFWARLCYFLSFLILLGGGLFYARQPIIEHFPQVAPLYQGLGMMVHQNKHDGLTLEPSTPMHTMVNGQKALVVRGTLRNDSKRTQAVPPVFLTLYASCAHGAWWQKGYFVVSGWLGHKPSCRMDTWKHTFSQIRLEPGEKLVFEAPPHAISVMPDRLQISF